MNQYQYNLEPKLFSWKNVIGFDNDIIGEIDSFPGEIIQTDEKISYHIDKFGHRNKIAPGGDVASGCSCTWGYGVPNPWPEQLNLYNLGRRAGSNDYIARSIVAYVREFKPANVYVMWTGLERREFFDHSRVVEWTAGTAQDRTGNAFLELCNPGFDLYHFEKNRLLVQYVCKEYNVTLHECSLFEPYNIWDLDGNEKARDSKHPGQKWHDAIAAHFLL